MLLYKILDLELRGIHHISHFFIGNQEWEKQTDYWAVDEKGSSLVFY